MQALETKPLFYPPIFLHALLETKYSACNAKQAQKVLLMSHWQQFPQEYKPVIIKHWIHVTFWAEL